MRTRDDAYDVKKAWGFAVLLALCAAALPLRAEEVALSTATAAAVEDEEPPYVYNASSRDPFIPLSGTASSDAGFSSSSDKEPGAFNPSNVELKGIIRTGTGRWASLAASTGERYIVENGKIHDAKKKAVEGYVGIIKEKTLVIIGPNNQVTELKMKRDQEEEEREKR